jgi:hypothetical protein
MQTKVSSRRRSGPLAIHGCQGAGLESSFFDEIDGGVEQLGDLILDVDDVPRR